jgi:hypothetical protein
VRRSLLRRIHSLWITGINYRELIYVNTIDYRLTAMAESKAKSLSQKQLLN